MRGSSQLIWFALGLAFAVSWLKDYAFIFSWLFSVAFWVIPVFAVIAAAIFGYERFKYVDVLYDKPVWYGAMRCRTCFYRWQSRKTTPPAKCPKCGRQDILPVETKEKAVHRLEKERLTAEDWTEIRKMGVQNFVPNWFVIVILLLLAELIYLYAGGKS
jgi:predicted RNA-binding Zn-ribbon protein involved in translation (DUF1610 family)